jgi:transcriptional regulator with XRE-family HTH domain
MRELALSGETRKIREAAGLTQAEIANVCGVTPSAVNRWESGQRIPRSGAARTYAAIVTALASGAKVSPR